MLKWVRSLVPSDEIEVATDRRLVLIVLGVSLAATILLIIANISREFVFLLAMTLVLAFILALRGKLRIAGLFGPLAGLVVITLLLFRNFGIRDTAVLGLPVVIVASSLLNGQKGVIVFGIASLLVVLSLGLAEFTGLTNNLIGSQNTLADYLVVCVVIMVTVAMQWAVIGRLRENIITVRRELVERQRIEHALRESEERYRTLLETFPDIIMVTNLQGKILFANNALEQQTGLTLEDLNTANHPGLIYPEDRSLVVNALRELLAGDKIQTDVIENRFIDKFGRVHWYSGIMAKTQWDGETVIQTITRDITERKQAEEALRTSEERYRTFIAQSTEGIRRYDLLEPIPVDLPEDEQIQRMLANMYIAECNDAFARMYGLNDASQLLGRRLNEMGLTDDNINFESLRTFIRSGYRVIDAEAYELGPDGENKVFLINTVGILENGYLVRAWGTQRDITENKRAGEEIRRLNAELEERVVERTSQLAAANKELEAFSYSISHDLRAPLRAINGFSDILRNDFARNMESTGKNFLDKIITAATEMDEKIDALLAFSRVTRSTLRYETLDLSQIAEIVIERLRSTEPRRKVACLIAPGLGVSADKALLQTLLENLLGNAWKYSSKNPEAQIEFGTCREQNGQEVFFVRDNGAGFDMRYAEKLFGAFQRLHHNDEFQGHGIGLATVKKIVEHHGGRIWAEAEVDKGATFYFTIP